MMQLGPFSSVFRSIASCACWVETTPSCQRLWPRMICRGLLRTTTSRPCSELCPARSRFLWARPGVSCTLFFRAARYCMYCRGSITSAYTWAVWLSRTARTRRRGRRAARGGAGTRSLAAEAQRCALLMCEASMCPLFCALGCAWRTHRLEWLARASRETSRKCTRATFQRRTAPLPACMCVCSSGQGRTCGCWLGHGRG